MVEEDLKKKRGAVGKKSNFSQQRKRDEIVEDEGYRGCLLVEDYEGVFAIELFDKTRTCFEDYFEEHPI